MNSWEQSQTAEKAETLTNSNAQKKEFISNPYSNYYVPDCFRPSWIALDETCGQFTVFKDAFRLQGVIIPFKVIAPISGSDRLLQAVAIYQSHLLEQ